MIVFLVTCEALAQGKVKIASIEREPYLGAQLPGNGYVIEVIKEAFQRVNYEVKIEFVTLARAQRLVKQGAMDGFVPSYDRKTDMKHYLLSSPFPGDHIGLLKKKSLDISFTNHTSNSFDSYLKQLKQYKFGIIRGDPITQRFDYFQYTKNEFVTNDVQNIDNLEKEAVDFIVIDKYSAGDIITNQRPHLIGHFDFIEPIDAQNSFYVAFSKHTQSHPSINKDFNQGLAEMRRDGTLRKIIEKHGFYPFRAQKKDKKKLIIGTVNNREMLRLQELSEVFEADNPHIEIDWRIMNESTLRKRLLSDLAISDGQFDIMTIGMLEVPVWSKNNWLTPLSNLPKSYDLNDIFDKIKHSLSFQNKLYALPFYAESSMTYYRKDLFKKAGIRMSSEPTYWEILSYADTIHQPEKEIYGVCLRGKAGWGENMGFFTTMVNTFGGQWFNQKWQPQIDSDAWKKALKIYKTMITKYGPPNPENNGYNENLALFLSGKCGIWIDATVAAGTLFHKNKSQVSQDVAVVKAPVAVTTEGANWLWSWALAIPMSSNHKTIAQQFISWATSKNYIELVASNDGWASVPPGTRKSTYKNKAYIEASPFAPLVFDSIVDTNKQGGQKRDVPYSGIQFVEIPEFPAIGNYVGQQISEVIQGKVAADVALKKAQKHVELQMRLSGYYDE